MSPTAAAALANILNFILLTVIAAWYVAPWLARKERAAALTVLLWVQAFVMSRCRFFPRSVSASPSPTAPEIRLLPVI